MPAAPPYLRARVPRNEDARLLTGRALFVDDVQLPGMLHVAFVRSEHAHGRLTSVDVSAARRRAGVHAVYTAADLGDYLKPGPILVSPPPIPNLVFHGCTQLPLAKDKVRHVGEPLAMIVADSRYVAEDAIRDVVVEIDPMDAVVDLEKGLAPDAPLIHEHLTSNLAAHVVQRKGDYASAKQKADVIVKRRFHYDRGISAAIENRAVAVDWNAKSEEMTIWDTTQAPIPIRNGLAAMLGLLESQVNVIAPFVGGGFGPKIMMFYPEEVLLPWAAMRLNRPLKWTEDRQENFYATTQERGQVHDAEMALTSDGRIIGVHDAFLFDTGAYDPYGLTIPINSQCTLLGPYDIPNYESEFTAVFTNKTIVTPVRGAGRQHGVFVSERLLDLASRELGIDRVEIRKRNLIAPDRFPVNHEIMFQDSAPLIYDSGDYLPTLELASEIIGYETFVRDDQPRLRAEGRHLGIGVVCYVEGTGIGPYEGARVTIEPSGKVRCATGVGTQGQGHFTVFAQLVADVLGVECRRCAGGDGRHARVSLGDRNLRKPRRGGRGQRMPCCRDGGTRESAEPRERGAGRAARSARAWRRPGVRETCGRARSVVGRAVWQIQSVARRRPSRYGAGSRKHGVLRPRPGQHGQRGARDDRRGRSRNRDGRDQALPRRSRLRHHHQPDAGRRADSRRRSARDRQCVLRAA